MSRSFCVSLILIFFLIFPVQIFACPCGCGSSEFLYLEPFESFKYQLSAKREFSPLFYDNNMNPRENQTQIRGIDTYEFSTVFSPVTGVSVSGQIPFKRNIGKDESTFSLADPSLHILISALDKDIENTVNMTLRPGFSIKFPVANSSENSRELNLFSNGYWELSPSLSAVFKYRAWSLNLKEIITVRLIQAETWAHPLINRFSLGVSYTFFGYGQVGTSLNQEIRFSVTEPIGAHRFSHDMRWTLGARIGDQKNLTFSVKHPVLFQKNSSFYYEFGLAFTHTI